MLRRRTVLTAGLGLLGCGDPRPAPADATPDTDLVALALAERAGSIHDASPPSATASTPLLLAADLGSLRTWDASTLALHADGRACLRRIRTALTLTLAPDVLARITTHLAVFSGDDLPDQSILYGHKRRYHALDRRIILAGDSRHAPPAIAALDAEVAQIAEHMLRADDTAAERLLVWHAREHLAALGTFDDELWIFADGHLLLRRADGTALPTFATRRVEPAALAFLTVALTRPIAPTDTVRPALLAPGTGHKFLLASLERELLVQPNEPLPPGLEAVLRETEWLRGAFA